MAPQNGMAAPRGSGQSFDGYVSKEGPGIGSRKSGGRGSWKDVTKHIGTAKASTKGFFSMPFDLFPFVPGAEEQEVKSYAGFLLTLFSVVIFVGFSAYTIQLYATQVYQKSIATVALETNRVVSPGGSPQLFEAGMLMRFTGNGSAFYDPSIFQYHFTARTVIDQDAGGKSSRSVVPLNLTACSFTTSQGNAGGSGICFDYNQTIAAMQGDFGYPIYRYIQLQIDPCVNGTLPGVVCKSQEFIDDFIYTQMEAVLITAHDVYVDDNVKIGKPMRKRHLYSSARYNFPPGITQKVDVFSQVRLLTRDNPVIAWDVIQTQFADITVGALITNVLATRASDSDSYIKMYLRLSADIQTANLVCSQSFIDMLTSLGSIYALLMLVFGKPGELLNGWLYDRTQRANEAAGVGRGDDAL